MIEVIYQLGDDALGNFFQIFIPSLTLVSTDPKLSGVSLDMENIILRTSTIQIPQSGANVYDVNYKTQTMPKVGGKVDSPKTFSMTLRIDRFYKEYEKILQWKNAIANPLTGVIGADNFASSAGGSNRVDITVQPIDSDGEVIPTALYWILHNAFIQTVPEISFDYSAGEPITVNLAFQFSTLEEVFPS